MEHFLVLFLSLFSLAALIALGWLWKNRARQASSFLANLSHELRTPLHGILSALEHQPVDVRTIRRESAKLLALTDDFLLLNKCKPASHVLQEINLLSLVEDALALRAQVHHGNDWDMWCEYDERLPASLLLDAEPFGRILAQLLDHLLATGEGNLVVRIHPGKEQEWAISFERNTSFISTPTLTLTQMLVESIGGKWEETAVGLSLIFPLLGSAHKAPRKNSSLCGRKALLVMENEPSRRHLARMCSHLGIRVEQAATSTEALMLFRGQRDFDLVLINLCLSGLDGSTLAPLLLSEAEALGGTLPHISIMAYPQEEGCAAAVLHYGVATLLSKPWKTSDLEKTLAEQLLTPARPLDPHFNGSCPAGCASQTVSCSENERVRRVLIVDDNTMNMDILGEQIRRLGHSPRAATGAREAMEILKREPCDAIFLDGQMPHIDGYEAARMIRAWEKTHATPSHHCIIALTATALAGERERCLSAGMDDYLPKPVSMEQIRAMLIRHGLHHHASCVQTQCAAPINPNDLIDFELLNELFPPGDGERQWEGPLANGVFSMVTTLRDRLKGLAWLLKEQGVEEIAREVHSLRGNLAGYGFVRCASQLEAMEHELSPMKEVSPQAVDRWASIILDLLDQSAQVVARQYPKLPGSEVFRR